MLLKPIGFTICVHLNICVRRIMDVNALRFMFMLVSHVSPVSLFDFMRKDNNVRTPEYAQTHSLTV